MRVPGAPLKPTKTPTVARDGHREKYAQQRSAKAAAGQPAEGLPQFHLALFPPLVLLLLAIFDGRRDNRLSIRTVQLSIHPR